MSSNGIRRITMTTDAVDDIVKIINEGKYNGVVDVRASTNNDYSHLDIEMDYLENDNPKIFTKYIGINLDNK